MLVEVINETDEDTEKMKQLIQKLHSTSKHEFVHNHIPFLCFLHIFITFSLHSFLILVCIVWSYRLILYIQTQQNRLYKHNFTNFGFVRDQLTYVLKYFRVFNLFLTEPFQV